MLALCIVVAILGGAALAPVRTTPTNRAWAICVFPACQDQLLSSLARRHAVTVRVRGRWLPGAIGQISHLNVEMRAIGAQRTCILDLPKDRVLPVYRGTCRDRYIDVE